MIYLIRFILLVDLQHGLIFIVAVIRFYCIAPMLCKYISLFLVISCKYKLSFKYSRIK